MSRDEFIDEILSLKNFKGAINSRLLELTERFNGFTSTYEMVNYDLSTSRPCSELLLDRIIQLKRNNINNAQYNQRENLEINPVPSDIDYNVLEEYVCHVLSLTETIVEPKDLQVCHHMKRKDRVNIELKCDKQRYRVICNRKRLQNKSLDLSRLTFSGKLFINESTCHEYEQLPYNIHQLKSAHKTHST